MLKLTDGAAKVLTSARSDLGAPDSHGVRFFTPGPDANGKQARLAFDFVDGPAANDKVSEVAGLKMFVAPEVDKSLGEATIDVEQAGDQARLVLQVPTDAGSTGS
jgi:Fe-S cluster assembly iron-binding protein IscA